MEMSVGDDQSKGAGIKKSLILAVLSFAICLRTLIGLQPHSGQDNFHGAKGAYGGDFEAQRHWMELTLHVPIGDWYYYDLEYWGLDYPPITAYVSYLCGLGSHHLVGPESVALETSRGIEDPTHKAYMRATVLVLEVIIYGFAVWTACYRSTRESLWLVLMALSQPAILLIDHGHFQYNTVALGWAISAFYFMTKGNFNYCILGSFYFCLALNFKQMTLYYAPAVFAYLLGRCFADPNKLLTRFILLGVTVIITFAATWAPMLVNGPSHKDTTILERVLQILQRIFPFQRGLFESKVANLWCALSTKPISIRDHLPASMQPILALALTTTLMLPSCFALFKIGAKSTPDAKRHATDWIGMLWGATSCSLAFFLASFQVHEKSILIALAPASLLLGVDPTFVHYFSISAAWSLWPLLQVDRLDVAYACTICIYICLIWMRPASLLQNSSSFFSSFFAPVPVLAYLGMAGLHIMQLLVKAPPNLPDLYPVLWSVAGCGMFCSAWVCSLWHLLIKQQQQQSQKIKDA